MSLEEILIAGGSGNGSASTTPAFISAANALTETPRTAFELFQEQQLEPIFTTGWKTLDSLLPNNGFCGGELYEIVGSSNSRKTELCHRLCASCSTMKNKECTALYIDSCGSFSPQLLANSFALMGLSDSLSIAFIKRIKIKKLNSADELIELLESILQADSSFINQLGIVIVDSISALLSPTLGSNPLGHSLLIKIARLMKLIAFEKRVCFVVTNWCNGSLKPAMGETWRTIANYQIALDLRNYDTIVATLIRSPLKPTTQSTITL